MNMVQTLPPQYERRAKSTYEQIVEEAVEKGMEMLLQNIMLNRPQLSDKEIVELLGIELALVEKVRQQFLQGQVPA